MHNRFVCSERGFVTIVSRLTQFTQLVEIVVFTIVLLLCVTEDPETKKKKLTQKPSQTQEKPSLITSRNNTKVNFSQYYEYN